MMNHLIYAGKNSADFEVYISGESTFTTPIRDIEVVDVPGRNGTLSIDHGRYANVNIPYPAFIAYDFRRNYDAFRAFMLSVNGYAELSDSYDEDHYRLARFNAEITPEMTQLNRHGKFTISFDCDPRRFRKDGKRVIEFEDDGAVKNPTLYTALPLIRVYGTGTVTVGGISVQIVTADGYTDINSEVQEAYKGSTNCNGNIVLTDGKFPEIAPGVNQIELDGITKVEIIPHWWTI